MDRWDQGGREHVERMLDLSDVPESSRAEEADLAAQYIRRDLQKLGLVQLLAISDDETSRDPFVYFRHPAGAIEIVPIADGKGEPTTWKFSAATLRTANDLYSEIAAMPDRSIGHGHAAPPATPYFALRDWVASIAPSLLEPLGVVAKWQVIAGFALLALCFLVGIVPALIVGAVLRLVFGSELHNINQVRLPLILAFGTLLWQIFSPYIGLPREVRQVTVPLVGVVMTLSLLLVAWRLVDVFSYNYITKAGKIGVDRIAFSLIMGVVRAALVAVAAANIADKLSIPYNGLLAGLGIGGLAFAFASRETLSNVFGAAILAADRPFKAGDWITVGEIDGDVEHVGIRSTRVRTLDDTVLIVPNGKLSDATITNHGTRRFRRAVSKLILAYDTPVELIDRFRQEIVKLISETPGAIPDKTEVYVRGFALEGPELNVTYLLDTTSWQVEWNTKHQVWTGVMALAKRLSVRFSEEERDRAIAGAAQRVFQPEADSDSVESSAAFSGRSSQAA
jgi:MscS family membrane protein